VKLFHEGLSVRMRLPLFTVNVDVTTLLIKWTPPHSRSGSEDATGRAIRSTGNESRDDAAAD
jgi:hypothetical protein